MMEGTVVNPRHLKIWCQAFGLFYASAEKRYPDRYAPTGHQTRAQIQASEAADQVTESHGFSPYWRLPFRVLP